VKRRCAAGEAAPHDVFHRFGEIPGKEVCGMKREKSNRRKSGVERLFEISRKDNIEKAIIIENNHVYTYGYQRYDSRRAAQ
jgi:hypothetical protein